ncbi:PD-(D/E)XK nuclease family protein, partial [Candidatus Sumerlaeota bacterium]|nr:PD-(D/E)XK nuclease family protein [Candidatus Sumerlaeota bacterium]
LDEDDLARIRIHQRNGGFFSAVLAYAARGPNEHLRQRLSDFLAQMENWRSMVRRGSLAQAIWAIYNETGYLDYVSAMDGGTQRRANLIGLYDRARQFDEFSRRGLGRFLEFIRQLQDAEGELASPPAQSEAEDTVRIMSIHKSKGLEFPVVFLADIARVFNFQSARGDLVVDRDLGLGVRNVDTDRAIKYPTAAHLVVGRQIERETMAEEMRLLYVAMTRAREKLVLCGSVRFDAALGKWLRFADDQESAVGPLDDLTVRSAKSFADWLGPALGRLGCLDESNAGNERFFQVEFHRADEWQGRQPTRPKPVEKILHDMAAMKPVSPPPHDHDLVAQVAERLNWRYRWQPLTEMRGKFSVSELKRRFEIGREADESVGRFLAAPQPRKPAFLMAEETTAPTLTAAERGTAFHTVMRCLDFESATDGEAVRKQIEEMEARGILSATEAAAVDVEAIARFSDSPLGKEMKQRAGHVWRELPFSLAVSDLSDLSDASDLSDQAWQDESVHLQGIIDCLIERPDGFVLVDFKTDQVAPEQAGGRAERYRFQLQLYTRAVETIFRRPVVARVLYFLRPAVAVEL